MNQLRMKIIVSTIVFFSLMNSVVAAELIASSNNEGFAPGEIVIVNITIDTAGELINAFEGSVVFPEDMLALREIRDGNSIINFWVEQPTASSGRVTFSGITPGGYRGGDGHIMSLIFEGEQTGNGSVQFASVRFLKNDGEGTSVEVQEVPFRFSISNEYINPTTQEEEDVIPPEDFTPGVARDPHIFDGKWFLYFASQDKGSGIDHYEVCEGGIRKCVFITDNKYLLENQELNKRILVKAVDRSGNERIVSLPAQNPEVWYKHYIIIAILIMIFLYINFVFGKRLWQKISRKRPR